MSQEFKSTTKRRLTPNTEFLVEDGIQVTRMERGVIRKMSLVDRAMQQWPQEMEAYDRVLKEFAWFLEANPTLKLSGVTAEGLPIFERTQSLDAAKTISANKVWQGGGAGLNLSGSGVAIALFDQGPLNTTHQELVGRVNLQHPHFGSSTHATSMAGIMISTGLVPGLRGMANQGSIRYYGGGPQTTQLILEAAQGTQVSNHSTGQDIGWNSLNLSHCAVSPPPPGGWVWYGVQNGVDPSDLQDPRFGKYSSSISGTYDQIIYEAETLLPVRAAGNARAIGPRNPITGQPLAVPHAVDLFYPCVISTVLRPFNGDPDGEGYYDTLNEWSVMKNALTVGAVHDIANGYQAPSNVVLWTNSSIGPTDDGRIKPDVVANGLTVTTTSNGSNTATSTGTGTSSATASVTGGLALLVQNHKNMHPTSPPLYASTIKALAIHTADEAGSHPGPDFKFGWGLVNIKKAAELQVANAANNSKPHIKEILLHEGEIIEFDVVKAQTGPLRVTIAWADPAPTVFSPLSSVDDTTKALVNDLDLRVITGAGSVVHQPWTLNADVVLERKNIRELPAVPGDNNTDNVEQVHISSLSPQNCTIRISHKGTVLVGGPQLVSIIISGNTPSSAPHPEILDMEPQWDTVGTSEFALSLQTLPGGWYELHQCNDLTNPNWVLLTGEISAPASVTTVTLPWEASLGGHYYKLIRTE